MFVRVNGRLLNTVSFGTGPITLVGLGGWVGNWEVWQQPFELLSAEWRCVSYDHRGSGETVVPLEDITPDGLVDDVFGVMDALGVKRCLLAGESLGSVVALEAVRRAPERFIGLVLVDGAPWLNRSVQPLIDGSKTDFEATLSAFVDACVPEPDSEHLRRWGRNMLRRSSGPAAARIFEAYLEPRRERVPLEALRLPALVLHGSDDVIVPLSGGELLAKTLPDAELVVLSGAGHVPTITRPREVADAMRGWVARRKLAT